MHTPGNIFSIVVFFIWIPIALWGARRWPPAKTAALLFLIPLMFLPEAVSFKLPGLPLFEKSQVAIVWLLVGVLLFHRHRLRAVRLSNWTKLAMFLLLAGNVVTVFLNSDPISYYFVDIPAHVPYDAVHSLVRNTLSYILPFVLGVAMFNSPKDLRVLFRVLVGAALVYSIFQLFELRMSPQLHRLVYGFFQHRFDQTVRGGGYRPTVFMTHGLAVAMFAMVGILAAAALYKGKIKVYRISAGWALAYLWLILLLSHSAAAFLYTLVGVPLILLATPKTQFRVAALLAVVVLLYPDVRGAGLVPVEGIRDWIVSTYGEGRASSIMTRFVNEEMLLERARERSFFGWGGHGRAWIYDPWTGKNVSIADGAWIITWGTWGRVGFLGRFLLLTLPILLSTRQLKRVRRESDRRLLAALAVIIGFSVFDLLPNGHFNYLVTALSGALAGCCRGVVRDQAWRASLRLDTAIDSRTIDHSPQSGSSSAA